MTLTAVVGPLWDPIPCSACLFAALTGSGLPRYQHQCHRAALPPCSLKGCACASCSATHSRPPYAAGLSHRKKVMHRNSQLHPTIDAARLQMSKMLSSSKAQKPSRAIILKSLCAQSKGKTSISEQMQMQHFSRPGTSEGAPLPVSWIF